MADCPTPESMNGTPSFMDPSPHAQENNSVEFYNWIMRRLGFPAVRIELSKDQIWDNMDTALTKFVSIAERPVKYFQFLTQQGQSIYNLPADWSGMFDEIHYIPNSIVDYIQSYSSYQMYTNFTGNLDVASYTTLMSHLQLKINMVGARPTFEVVYNPPRLKVFPTPTNPGSSIVFAYIAKPRLEDWCPQLDLEGYNWTREYALALCKMDLGRVRSRFGDTVVAGDNATSNDGSVLLAEGKEEKSKLEERLDELRRPMPIIFF